MHGGLAGRQIGRHGRNLEVRMRRKRGVRGERVNLAGIVTVGIIYAVRESSGEVICVVRGSKGQLAVFSVIGWYISVRRRLPREIHIVLNVWPHFCPSPSRRVLRYARQLHIIR